MPEESGFHDEEVSVLAIELGDYFRFFGGRLGLGEGAELWEAGESSLFVKKSARSP